MSTDPDIKKPSEFTPSSPIGANDIFPRSHYLGPSSYNDMQTSILDISIAIGKTEEATGFTFSGGTISKKLTILDDVALDQDLLTISDPLFNSVTAPLFQSDEDLDIYSQANNIKLRIDGIKLLTDGGKVSVNYPTDPLSLFTVGGDICSINDDPQIIFTDNAGVISGKIGILIGGESVGGANLQGFDYVAQIPINSYIGAYGGNVGLGTTFGNPAADYPVHIHGLTAIGTFDGSDEQLILKDENNADKQLVFGFNNVDGYGHVQSYSSKFALTPTATLINKLGGNVGIGGLAFAEAPVHLHGNTFIDSGVNKERRLEMGFDDVILQGFIQANFDGVGLSELHLNHLGNSVSVNLPLGTGSQSPFHVEGDMFLREITTPTTPTVEGGKLYSKSGDLYFLNDLGVERNVFNGSTYTGSNGIKLVANDFQFDNTYSPDFVNLTLLGIGSSATITGPSSSLGIDSAGTLSLTSGAGQLALTANSGSGQIILNGGSTTVFNQLYLSDCPLYVGSPGSELLKIDWDNVNLGMTIDSLNGGGGSSPLWINPSAGNVSIGLSTAIPAQANLDIGGGISLGYIATPGTPRANTGFLYPESDNILYWKTPASSQKIPLNSVRKRISTAVDVNAPSDDFVVLDSGPGANLFVIDLNNIRRPLTIKWVSGVSQPQFQPAAGQTIDGTSATYTITTLQTSITFLPNPFLATDISILNTRGTFV